MEAVYIPQLLKAPEQTQVLEIDEFVPELDTLTPVRGWVRVSHHGNYLEVSARAEAIMTLSCHRCLQQYNYRLKIEPSEIIWLEIPTSQPELIPLEREVATEDLVETLSPQGYFEPDEWLYEQLCLAIPPRQLCDLQCPGIEVSLSDTLASEENPKSDSRWSALEALKRQLSQ
jgi:uncharacterized protein